MVFHTVGADLGGMIPMIPVDVNDDEIADGDAASAPSIMGRKMGVLDESFHPTLRQNHESDDAGDEEYDEDLEDHEDQGGNEQGTGFRNDNDDVNPDTSETGTATDKPSNGAQNGKRNSCGNGNDKAMMNEEEAQTHQHDDCIINAQNMNAQEMEAQEMNAEAGEEPEWTLVAPTEVPRSASEPARILRPGFVFTTLEGEDVVNTMPCGAEGKTKTKTKAKGKGKGKGDGKDKAPRGL